MERAFDGIKNLYGNNGLKKISNAHFLVIGIGGVGSWVCEALIRSGVTKLSILDLDDICISNLNRQVHTLHSNIGKTKIEEMKKRLLDINPNIDVTCIYDFFSEGSKEEILSKKYDYIFDAIDSLKSKCILISECKKRKLPLICIGGAGGRTDPTKIEIKDLNRTINDKLLLQVRRELKRKHEFWRYHDHPYNIPTVFSKEFAKMPNIEPCDIVKNKKLNCQTDFGSASFVTGGFAFAAVSYVLNKITNN